MKSAAHESRQGGGLKAQEWERATVLFQGGFAFTNFLADALTIFMAY